MPIVSLIGQDALQARLLAAHQQGALPASLLFHGPPGVGKQRLALWLARAMLCTAAQPACGACENCRFTAELTHPDLHWVFPRPRPKDADPSAAEVRRDAADAIADRVKAHGLYAPPSGTEGIFIATVRAMLQQATLSPALARRKVFVVGDAERMVSQEGADQAANAFLKLLEEPPADTTIIITSSEPGALLPTIRSRVVAVRVPSLPDADVRRWLQEPTVRAALDAARLPASDDERVRLAGGAPGLLLGSTERGEAIAAAGRLLDAATGGSRARRLRAAFGTGSSKARGAFSDTLDAVTVQLHDRVRDAVRRGDDRAAAAAARAVDAVETAKQRAAGNVTPQLIAAGLMREIADGTRR